MRLNDVRGKPIVSADTGEKAGHVEDLLLDSPRHHIVGVLVSDGVLSKQRVLPFDQIQTVGVDAVIVTSLRTICDPGDWVSSGHPATRSRSVNGKEVVTAEGARIGKVRDLVADERTGDIVALEIDSGRYGKRLSGPVLVHAIGEIPLTNAVVVVPSSVAATRPDADAKDNRGRST